MEIIAKAFITKWTHVISLIRAEKGRNSYINDKNKLHSGVRVNFKSNIFKSNNAHGVERVDPTTWLQPSSRAPNTLTKRLRESKI